MSDNDTRTPFEREIDDAPRLGRDMLIDMMRWNAGARIADDCFCDVCGARGYLTTCPRCTWAA